MKNIIFLIFTSCLFISCTDVEYDEIYTISFKNTSEHTLQIDISYFEQMSSPITLQPGESTEDYGHPIINDEFLGFFTKDQIIIKFENQKGYLCTKNGTSNLCFVNKESPFSEIGIGAYIKIDENHYIYEITQEDYENAHVLE